MSNFYQMVQSLSPVMARSFTRGTVDVLDGYGRATTLPSDGQWARDRKFGIQHYSTPSIVADGAEQQVTSGTLFVEMSEPHQQQLFYTSILQRLFSKQSAVGAQWALQLYHSGAVYRVRISDGVTISYVSHDWRTTPGIAVSFESGSIPKFYADGNFVGNGTAAVTITAAAAQINMGAYYTGLDPLHSPIHFAAQFPTVLTPKQISDLHEAFLAQPTDFRPTKTVILPVVPNEDSVETFGALINSSGEIVGKQGVSGGSVYGPTPHVKDRWFSEGSLIGYNDLNSGFDLSNPETLMPLSAGAVECVYTPPASVPATQYIIGANVHTVFRLGAVASGTGTPYFSMGSPSGTITGPANTLHPGVPVHLVATWEDTGATPTMELFVDGHSVGTTTFTRGSAATYARYLYLSTTTTIDGKVPLSRFYAERITPAKARALYVDAARAGGVHDNATQMPPITLANKTSGTIGPWEIGSGSWSVEDNGLRTIVNASSGWAAQPSSQAFGAWYWRGSHTIGSNTYFVLCSSERAGRTVSTPSFGYEVLVDSAERIRARVINAGTGTTIFITATGYVDPGTEYEFFLTRRYDGLFTLWIRGGDYTTWTTVGSGTDTTHTTCSFQVADIDTGDTLSSFNFYPLGGTLTPGDVPGLED